MSSGQFSCLCIVVIIALFYWTVSADDFMHHKVHCFFNILKNRCEIQDMSLKYTSVTNFIIYMN